jgi:CRP-like cAMP-binding protein
MMEATASVLARQQFLSDLPADQLDALAATASEVTFPAGQRICADGGYVTSFWLIESGRVTLDAQVPGECPAVVGPVGIGGLSGSTRQRCGTCARPIRLLSTSSPGGCSMCSRSG